MQGTNLWAFTLQFRTIYMYKINQTKHQPIIKYNIYLTLCDGEIQTSDKSIMCVSHNLFQSIHCNFRNAFILFPRDYQLLPNISAPGFSTRLLS
jgi:hypothetical protein